ncbi:4953_t:CDS:2 [Acaulospora morrowiae]|uniref:4953_t:CDS:1 n=1 Tax=Acaulospora morrowiae TaxID=94023 RepID=A0A9N8VWJ3_9GLOM|nr:4953_t:CDS:2 [Acaulospora morrowiae]
MLLEKLRLGEQELDLPGPSVYLSQVEEFPTETEEDQEEEETVEDKIREMELDEELEEEQIEQAKGALIREQDLPKELPTESQFASGYGTKRETANTEEE